MPLSVFAPLVLVLAALTVSPVSGLRAAAVPRIAEAAAALALFAALAGAAQFAVAGAAAFGAGVVTLRLDVIGVVMSVLVGFVGWVVAGLRVHVTNGVYVNAALDRLIGGFRSAKVG